MLENSQVSLPKLSIIIVSYNCKNYVRECLISFYNYVPKTQFEILLVDNESNDNPEELIKDYPDIKIIKSGYNSGFARANNLGMKIARGDYIVLLNPDTVFIENILDICYCFMENNKSYIACGVQLLFEDKSPQISGNFNVPGGYNSFLTIPFWGPFLRKLGLVLKTKKPSALIASSLLDVDWINGAFMFVRKSILAQSGLMDEDFFMYAEEAEWAGRLQEHGKLCILGELKLIHLLGKTSEVEYGSANRGFYNLTNKKGLQIMLSTHIRIRKQFGVGWFLFSLINFLFGSVLGFPIQFILQILNFRYDGFSYQIGFLKNVLKLLGYTFHIIRNKPYFYKVI